MISAQQWADLTGEAHVLSAPGQVGGILPGARGDTAEIAELDSLVRNLNADAMAQIENPVATVFVTGSWMPFFTQWNLWFAENSTVPLVLVPGVNFNTNKGNEFREFVQAYNEKLRAFKALGLPTSAKRDDAFAALGSLGTAFKDASEVLGAVGMVAAGAAAAYLAWQLYVAYKIAR